MSTEENKELLRRFTECRIKEASRSSRSSSPPLVVCSLRKEVPQGANNKSEIANYWRVLSRNSRRRYLPVVVFGSSSRISTWRGYL
jgi:hypothetical protein